MISFAEEETSRDPRLTSDVLTLRELQYGITVFLGRNIYQDVMLDVSGQWSRNAERNAQNIHRQWELASCYHAGKVYLSHQLTKMPTEPRMAEQDHYSEIAECLEVAIHDAGCQAVIELCGASSAADEGPRQPRRREAGQDGRFERGGQAGRVESQGLIGNLGQWLEEAAEAMGSQLPALHMPATGDLDGGPSGEPEPEQMGLPRVRQRLSDAIATSQSPQPGEAAGQRSGGAEALGQTADAVEATGGAGLLLSRSIQESHPPYQLPSHPPDQLRPAAEGPAAAPDTELLAAAEAYLAIHLPAARPHIVGGLHQFKVEDSGGLLHGGLLAPTDAAPASGGDAGARPVPEQRCPVIILVRRAVGTPNLAVFAGSPQIPRSSFTMSAAEFELLERTANEDVEEGEESLAEAVRFCVLFFAGIGGPSPRATHLLADPLQLVGSGAIFCSATEYLLGWS